MAEFIYTMYKVRKTAGEKVILDDVTLSFYPGAKIGVVGPNGAGKSTMLKIMAGLEHANNGEANLAKGASVGILLQEPPLREVCTGCCRGHCRTCISIVEGRLPRCRAGATAAGSAGGASSGVSCEAAIRAGAIR